MLKTLISLSVSAVLLCGASAASAESCSESVARKVAIARTYGYNPYRAYPVGKSCAKSDAMIGMVVDAFTHYDAALAVTVPDADTDMGAYLRSVAVHAFLAAPNSANKHGVTRSDKLRWQLDGIALRERCPNADYDVASDREICTDSTTGRTWFDRGY